MYINTVIRILDMPRPKTQCETLTIGQLAKRWGIGRDHARGLVDHNAIRGAFTIPSAGRYGETIRIPLASVLLAERGLGKFAGGRSFPRNLRGRVSGTAIPQS